MNQKEFIDDKVQEYYWEKDLNCATTTLKILAELYGVDLNRQIIDAAAVMHGAGGYGAQCGLVEGTIMFLGLAGKPQGMNNEEICLQCREFARGFTDRFGSLTCSVLRPQGFHPDNPPHLCAGLTRQAVAYSAEMAGKALTANKL